MNQDTLESVITERHLLENEGPVFAQPIGSDKIASEAHIEHQEQLERSDEDELARTAGELLSNVQHDQSQKFKSSNFLSLMRQLRDREVRVEGDKIVDVSVNLGSILCMIHLREKLYYGV